MAQLYEVEWCRKRMQIAWKENKNSMYVYRNSKVEDWNAADGTWPNRLMLSYFSHESSMTLVIKLEILLTNSNFSLT